MLNKISGVKYNFAVRFLICNVCNKVEDKRILLDILNYTSLESLFHLKRGEAVFDRHKGAFFQNKKVSILIRRLCMWVYILLLRNGILLG